MGNPSQLSDFTGGNMSKQTKSEILKIHVEPQVAASLKAESAESGAPVSEIIRRAIALRKSHAPAAERRPISPSFVLVDKETR
jgi:hypothetical protein